MGNSGSVHNLAALDDHRYSPPNHAQHQLQYLQQHSHHPNLDHHPVAASSTAATAAAAAAATNHQWSQSIPRTAHAQRPPHSAGHSPPPSLAAVRPIKVLPSLAAGVGARLRATNNGDILHGGGTLSGRREPGYRCVRPDNANVVPPQPMRAAAARPPLMQRSQTQLNLVQDRTPPMRRPTPLAAFQKLQRAQTDGHDTFKRFDSEPDLRGIDGKRPTDNGHRPSATVQPRPPPTASGGNSRMAAVRKKLAPPPPAHSHPLVPAARNPSYDPTRFGWKPPAPKPPAATNDATPRRLRLFKTKAESRRATAKPEAQLEPTVPSFASLPHHGRSTTSKPHPSAPAPAPANLLPQPGVAPYFRRENSFDVSLLRLHAGGRRPSSCSEDEADATPGSVARPTTDAAAVPRTGTEFQRELLEVTRRRSINHHHTAVPVAAVAPVAPGAASPFLAPIPRVRHLPGRQDEQQHQKQHGASVVPTSAPPPPPPPPPVPDAEQSTKKEGTGSGKAEQNHSPQQPPQQRAPPDHLDPLPIATKTFYFGMDTAGATEQAAPAAAADEVHLIDEYLTNKIQMDVIDRFAESLLQKQNRKRRRLQQQRANNNNNNNNNHNNHSNLNPNHNPSSLDSSSAMDSDEDDMLDDRPPRDAYDAALESATESIQVHMRPTLPRRQFEIPRFSPAAAWRTLATGDEGATSGASAKSVCPHNQFSSYAADESVLSGEGGGHHHAMDDGDASFEGGRLGAEDAVPAPLERRIERIYREPMIPGGVAAAAAAAAFAADTKSGDSGISGDAGPLRADSPTMAAVVAGGGVGPAAVGPFLAAWTPLQDLGDEDEEEDDDEVGGEEGARRRRHGVDRMSGDFGKHNGHTFSLSLPRDAKAIGGDLSGGHVNGFKSLQKLGRRTSSDEKERDTPPIPPMPLLSTVVGGGASTTDAISYRLGDTNWLLSRSAPNSIELFDGAPPGFDRKSAETDAAATTGTASRRPRQQQPPSFGYITGGQHVMYLPNHTSTIPPPPPAKSPADEEPTRKYSTDSVDTVDTAPPSSGHPTQPAGQSVRAHKSRHHTGHSHHRFTFQSTVRQIERRRLAERLSRDAEQMEAQRLSESEAMRRVEEEFQRKRASEKASIRQQLRLFTQMHGGGRSGGGGVGVVDLGMDTGATDTDLVELGHVMPTGGGTTSRGHRSLPYEWQTLATRADPDGAVATPDGSPRPPSKFPSSSSPTADEQPIRRQRRPRPNDDDNDDDDDASSTVSSSSSTSSVDPELGGHRMDDHHADYNDHSSNSSDAYALMDTKTPYIMRLIEAKSGDPLSRHRAAGRPPPTTEILSEFRNTSNTRREYVDYRGGVNVAPTTKHHPPTVGRIHNSQGGVRLQQQHHHGNHGGAPSAAATGVDEADHSSQNYRRDFAHGRSVCSSDSDLSGPTNTGHPNGHTHRNSRRHHPNAAAGNAALKSGQPQMGACAAGRSSSGGHPASGGPRGVSSRHRNAAVQANGGQFGRGTSDPENDAATPLGGHPLVAKALPARAR